MFFLKLMKYHPKLSSRKRCVESFGSMWLHLAAAQKNNFMLFLFFSTEEKRAILEWEAVSSHVCFMHHVESVGLLGADLSSSLEHSQRSFSTDSRTFWQRRLGCWVQIYPRAVVDADFEMILAVGENCFIIFTILNAKKGASNMYIHTLKYTFFFFFLSHINTIKQVAHCSPTRPLCKKKNQ